MRVVTWNVWWRFGPRWRDRQPGIAAVLAGLRPDVVGLQESWATDRTSQAAELGGRLGLHAAFSGPSLPPVPVPPEHPEQAGVELGLGLLSRWPIDRVSEHRLPATHREPPVAMVATLAHPDGPLHVVVSCVEWEPEYAADQLAQTEALAALATDPALDGPLPVLLLADLNAPPGVAQARPLFTSMIDTWVAGSGDPGAVTLSSTHPSAPVEARHLIDRRIDYVLARPGRPGTRVPVRQAFVAGDGLVDGVHPSDHYAVVADLDLDLDLDLDRRIDPSW
ncbi:endonuclease/exonuclease/phosphatase family protein [Plantactinospora sp. GCM10030261]|uniref:endonuclease/exonuclease/phosphatase family protein n=1 Tax=Plantactinospora sp. GCM10030261 TaxID=3273420 RepID=UPI00360C55E5